MKLCLRKQGRDAVGKPTTYALCDKTPERAFELHGHGRLVDKVEESNCVSCLVAYAKEFQSWVKESGNSIGHDQMNAVLAAIASQENRLKEVEDTLKRHDL